MNSTSPASSAKAEADGVQSKLANLQSTVVTGLKWNFATQIVGEGTRAIVTIVLARILTPGDYGIAAMAIVCASFGAAIMDPSLGLALVQRPRITEKDKSTVFWTMLCLGSLATLSGIALSGFVAQIFGQPKVRDLFAVLSLTFLLNAVAVTPMSLLNRQLAYRSMQIRQIGATVLGATAAVAVAVAGFGPWAIIANQLAATAMSTALVWRLSTWRPRAQFSRDSLRSLGSFGIKVFGAKMLAWASLNMDNALIGRFLGSAALGAYSLAYNVMYVPLVRIADPVMQVMSPAFARLQGEPDRLERVWLRSKRLCATLLVPAHVAGIVVAPDLIHVAFGSKWNAAVVPLQLLCIAGVAQTLVALNWSILTAHGQGGPLFRMNLIHSALTVAAFAAGLPFGIVGVAGFYAAARWILVLIDMRITTRAISFDFWAALRSGGASLPLAAAAGAVAFGLRQLLVGEGIPAAVRLVVVGPSLIAVYIGIVLLVTPSLVAEAKDALRGRGRASAPRLEPAPAPGPEGSA